MQQMKGQRALQIKDTKDRESNVSVGKMLGGASVSTHFLLFDHFKILCDSNSLSVSHSCQNNNAHDVTELLVSALVVDAANRRRTWYALGRKLEDKGAGLTMKEQVGGGACNF